MKSNLQKQQQTEVAPVYAKRAYWGKKEHISTHTILGAGCRWVANITRQPLLSPGKKPGTQWAARWVGPVADLDVRETWKIFLSRGFEPRNVRPVA